MLCLVIATQAVVFGLRNRRLAGPMAGGAVAIGTVSVPSGSAPHTEPTIRFVTATGQPVSFIPKKTLEYLPLGGTVRVAYDPAHPSDARELPRPGARRRWEILAWLALVGAGAGMVGTLVQARRGRRPEQRSDSTPPLPVG